MDPASADMQDVQLTRNIIFCFMQLAQWPAAAQVCIFTCSLESTGGRGTCHSQAGWPGALCVCDVCLCESAGAGVGTGGDRRGSAAAGHQCADAVQGHPPRCRAFAELHWGLSRLYTTVAAQIERTHQGEKESTNCSYLSLVHCFGRIIAAAARQQAAVAEKQQAQHN